MNNMRRWTIWAIGLSLVMILAAGGALAQRQRKPQRAQPPKFTGKEFSGTFFEDVSSVLQGTRPTGQAAAVMAQPAGSNAAPAAANGAPSASPGSATGAGDGWAKLISAATIEDTVKNSKLRLDQLVASPTKFAGGYVEARREFSLQALMFAIIEQYPGDVRWKRSAALARESLAKMAANAKVSSPQAYKEAKQRVLDLGELLNGSNLEGTASSELVWGDVIDRVPLMQLLEWAQQEHINGFASSKENFAEHKEELQRYAELVATLGKAAIMNDMPDAADAEYRGLGEQMIQQAGQIVLAVQTDNADLARQSAGQVGQTCAKCHDGYR
jgi:hypothetical protein